MNNNNFMFPNQNQMFPQQVMAQNWMQMYTMGQQLPNFNNMTEEEYSLINDIWKQKAKERMKIMEIINELQGNKNNFQKKVEILMIY